MYACTDNVGRQCLPVSLLVGSRRSTAVVFVDAQTSRTSWAGSGDDVDWPQHVCNNWKQVLLRVKCWGGGAAVVRRGRTVCVCGVVWVVVRGVGEGSLMWGRRRARERPDTRYRKRYPATSQHKPQEEKKKMLNLARSSRPNSKRTDPAYTLLLWLFINH